MSGAPSEHVHLHRLLRLLRRIDGLVTIPSVPELGREMSCAHDTVRKDLRALASCGIDLPTRKCPTCGGPKPHLTPSGCQRWLRRPRPNALAHGRVRGLSEGQMAGRRNALRKLAGLDP